MTTAYPTQPFTDFKHWKIFILGQNAIYEGKDLVRHDTLKPFTINDEHLALVNKAKNKATHNPARESLASLASDFTSGIL